MKNLPDTILRRKVPNMINVVTGDGVNVQKFLGDHSTKTIFMCHPITCRKHISSNIEHIFLLPYNFAICAGSSRYRYSCEAKIEENETEGMFAYKI